MDDLELLARLIKCEAGGEGNVGMASVATVVMNRVRAFEGEYGRYNTVYDVLNAPGQFECVTGNTSQNIVNMVPEQIHYQIAEWALNGNRVNMLSDAFWFFNPYNPYCQPNFPSAVGNFDVRVGDHCFYEPSIGYWST